MDKIFNIVDFVNFFKGSANKRYRADFSQTTLYTSFIEKKCDDGSGSAIHPWVRFFDDCIAKYKKWIGKEVPNFIKPETGIKVLDTPLPYTHDLTKKSRDSPL